MMRIEMKGITPLLLVSALALTGCGDDGPDAYGTFEATEVTVSAETAGRVLELSVPEGARVGAGERVGVLDTTQVSLQIREIESQRRATGSDVAAAEASAAAIQAELEVARRELARTRRLFEGQAATAQQLDQATSRVEVLEARLVGARDHVRSVSGRTEAMDAQVDRLRDVLARSDIINPIRGTVLTRYAEIGEFVQPGTPLYRVANLDSLTLRAYVSGAQLPSVRLGDRVRVQFDGPGGEIQSREGRVEWIASEAEFTPTPIQTREERTDLVYAVQVQVPNADGALKIGMPGEMVIEGAGETAAVE